MTIEHLQVNLTELQAIRRNYTAGSMEWWAMSLAIDALIGVSAKGIAEDITRLQNSRQRGELCTTQK